VAQFIAWKISQVGINKHKQSDELIQCKLELLAVMRADFRRLTMKNCFFSEFFLQSLHMLKTLFLVHHFISAKFFRHNFSKILNKTYSDERHLFRKLDNI